MRTAVGLIVRMRRPRSPSGSRTYGLLGFDTVIVIDDFSTDRSANLIQAMSSRFDVLSPTTVRCAHPALRFGELHI